MRYRYYMRYSSDNSSTMPIIILSIGPGWGGSSHIYLFLFFTKRRLIAETTLSLVCQPVKGTLNQPTQYRVVRHTTASDVCAYYCLNSYSVFINVLCVLGRSGSDSRTCKYPMQ